MINRLTRVSKPSSVTNLQRGKTVDAVSVALACHNEGVTMTDIPATSANAPQIAIIGGGPGGYEAALVAARLGAQITIIERQGIGGAAVLTDVVPSKTLIATAEWMTLGGAAAELGIRINEDNDSSSQSLSVDLKAVNARVRALAIAQSQDIRARLESMGVVIINGQGRLLNSTTIAVTNVVDQHGNPLPDQEINSHFILLATGATPRILPAAKPDGKRIMTWTQLYNLEELPEKLIVVGSGVTGAEFAGAYHSLGTEVVLVSSRDRVLPGEDADAANLIEEVFKGRGMTVMGQSRAEAAEVKTDQDGKEFVEVTLSDGRTVTGSHVLLAVGSIPNTQGLGLEEIGVRLTKSGHIETDKVSRTTVGTIYAAGDCTGVLPLASVAAMQGRVAMAHALGDSVKPIKLRSVAANIFTAPEIATVGYTQKMLDSANISYEMTMLGLRRNPRAKMMGMREGFVKLFATKDSGVILGGVVVAPRASELIYPITLAVTQRLTVDDVSDAFTIYPSLTGTIAEVARMGHQRIKD